MIQRKLALFTFVLLTASFAAAQNSTLLTDSTGEWQGTMQPGSTLRISNTNGNISATPASGNQVEIAIEKRAGRDGRPDQVWVEIVQHSDGITVCTVHSSRPPAAGECRTDGRTGWNLMGRGGRNVSVRYEVRVPAGVKLVAENTNGDIRADELQSVIEAETTNGNVRLSTNEWATASSTNGNVVVSMNRADWSGRARFSSTNGNVDVSLPSNAQFEVEASTTNGSINTDFPVTTVGRITRRQVRGTVNGGGRELRLSTTNGSIRLRSQGM